MKVCDVAKKIENIAPICLAEDYDNVGLFVGSGQDDVKGIVISLDLTESAIDCCNKNNCNLIITHHPVIFNPIKSVLEEDYVGALLSKCIKFGINVYAAHTNMDMSEQGINFEIAKRLGIAPQKFLSDGLGVVGDYNGDLDEILLKLCEITGETSPKVWKSKSGEKAKNHKIAFISGSGGRIDEVISASKEKGISTFISSEFKHNILLELISQDVSVIEIGHFESEIVFVDIVYNLLKTDTDNLHKVASLI